MRTCFHVNDESRASGFHVAGRVHQNVGGAVGNNVEGRRNEQTFDVYLRMDDGRRVVVNQRQMGNLREGDYVRVTNGNIVLIR